MTDRMKTNLAAAAIGLIVGATVGLLTLWLDTLS